MSNVKKVILKQNGRMAGFQFGGRTKEIKDMGYKVVGLENTVGYKIGEVISKHDVQQLINKSNTDVVVK
tara:strand:+ start:334 stop:540 length:207 start_codon:yes stop_codon:yes gene_type:complete